MSDTTTSARSRGLLKSKAGKTFFASLAGFGALAFAGIWAAGGGFAGRALAHRTLAPGMRAPDFSLPTSDGRTMHLADYRGRAVFLVFVPKWDDARTLAEIRSLRTRAPQYDMAGAKVMLVGPAAGSETAKALHDREHLPFPVLLDPGTLAHTFDVASGYRASFVVTPQGMVKFRISDAATDAANHGQQLIDVSKCCIDEVAADRAHGIGKPVGDYSLPRMDAALSNGTGSMETIYGDGSQKATVVLFISTKCPCANSYDDRIRNWSTTYGPRGVRFVAVYANADETPSDIVGHTHLHGFGFTILRDDHALCADHFHASVTPECFVLDGAHTLRYAGRLDDSRDGTDIHVHDLTASLDSILTGAAAPAETRAFGCAIVR